MPPDERPAPSSRRGRRGGHPRDDGLHLRGRLRRPDLVVRGERSRAPRPRRPGRRGALGPAHARDDRGRVPHEGVRAPPGHRADDPHRLRGHGRDHPRDQRRSRLCLHHQALGARPAQAGGAPRGRPLRADDRERAPPQRPQGCERFPGGGHGPARHRRPGRRRQRHRARPQQAGPRLPGPRGGGPRPQARRGAPRGDPEPRGGGDPEGRAGGGLLLRGDRAPGGRWREAPDHHPRPDPRERRGHWAR